LLLYQSYNGDITNAYAIGFSTVVLFLLVVLRVVGLLRNIEIQALKLNVLSRMDELTGLPNRRTIFQELPLALERARRDNTPIVVAMIDLDKFKLFNDTYGHPAGDKLLKGAASAWSEKLRTVDLLARYGGEEFIALLPNTNEEDAVRVLERLRPGTPADQTFSAGIASWNRLETPEELVMRADQALYRAKERGRNCSVRASEVIPAT
jgi:diguanylate cyclase (GGDEF)-like protein